MLAARRFSHQTYPTAWSAETLKIEVHRSGTTSYDVTVYRGGTSFFATGTLSGAHNPAGLGFWFIGTVGGSGTIIDNVSVSIA